MKTVKVKRVVEVDVVVFENTDLINDLREYFDCFLDDLITPNKEKPKDIEFLRRSIQDSILQLSFVNLCRQCLIRKLISLDTFVLCDLKAITVKDLLGKESL